MNDPRVRSVSRHSNGGAVRDTYTRQTTPQQYPQYGTPNGSLTPQSLAALLANAPPATPVNDMEKLLGDVEGLIAQSKENFARSPYDQGIQQKLKALLDLQTLLKTQQLPPSSLQAVKDQVAALSTTIKPLAPAGPASGPASLPMSQAPGPQANRTPTPHFPANVLAQLLGQSSSNPTPPSQPPSAPPPPAAPSTSVNLASLLQAQAPPPPASNPAPSSALGGNPLLDALRTAGLLGGGATPPSNSSAPTPIPMASQLGGGNDVQMTNNSIRQYVLSHLFRVVPNISRLRPHLISLLYESRPNRCHACGRRFPATEEGRERKQRHLDWHYTVKTRIAEGSKRGAVNRDWYVNELVSLLCAPHRARPSTHIYQEWIAYREQDEANEPTEADTAGPETKQPVEQFVRVPADAAMQRVTCPICQDQFQPSWRDDEWVWMDALEAGGRIYHASCYKEATKDSISLPGRQKSPPVLGKRKAGAEVRGELEKRARY
jgi:pre-mRNA cleavage complex 2 protein Pcf11